MNDAISPRRAALMLLDAVLRRGHPLDEAWRSALRGSGGLASHDARDRAFARQIVATALRRLGQIDAVIGHFLDRPLASNRSRVMDILRLGAAQLLFLATPAHAAVDASVTLAARDKTPGIRSMKGLVNAVLRRISEHGAGLLSGRYSDIRLNVPDWLWQSWSAAYGDRQALAIAARHLEDPPLDLTLKSARDIEKWSRLLDAEILPTGGLRRRGGGRIEALPGFSEGAWWVQDAAAALPARLLGAVTGRKVIDLCAAPGGKTAQLAAMGARVTAVDRSARRLATVRENLERLDLAAELIEADAREWMPAQKADFIMLDAPCSATGTLRRHPDIGHLKSPGDVASMVKLQDQLIDAALAMLAPGGILIYCTCSLQPEEGPGRISSALARHPTAERQAITADEIDGAGDMRTDDGDLRTLPCHFADLGGLDGFYAARLRMTA